MLFNRKLDTLVAKAFVGPYFMAFLLAEFVLVMQFLWKYIDDISGKGIGTLEILELVFYFALTLIPKAIPITVLLSSVFVFGNMSEKFELTSMKSAGISFYRIMRVGIMIGLMTALLSVVASNLIVPKANHVFLKRFYGIKKAKPSMVIEKGIFNTDFTGYKIYVGEKDKNGKDVSQILIYDHTNVESKRINVITAKTGKMAISQDGKKFVMTLFDGEQIRELKENAKNMGDDKTYPLTRATFERWQKTFDMSEFQMKEDETVVNRRPYDLLNTPQLLYTIDSVQTEIGLLTLKNMNNYSNLVKVQKEKDITITTVPPEMIEAARDAKLKEKRPKAYQEKINRIKKNKKAHVTLQIDKEDIKSADSFLATLLPAEKQKIVKTAYTTANHINNQLLSVSNKVYSSQTIKNTLRFKLHQQYSWALICLMFLFIGAPLGSIIRKGGYGFPLLVSILFFMLFIIMDIMGGRLLTSRVLNPYVAAWLPNIILFPFAIIFTYKAVRDSRFNFSMIKNIVSFFRFSKS